MDIRAGPIHGRQTTMATNAPTQKHHANHAITRRLWRVLRRLHRDEAGTATIEFTLVFPVLLVLALLLAQTAAAMAAGSYVHYAAFAAARTAIVQVPREDVPGEPALHLDTTVDGLKREAIWTSAAFTCVPVSGRIAPPAAVGENYAAGVADMYASAGQSAPGWTSTLAERVTYALANTGVRILVPTPESVENGDVFDFEAAPDWVVYAPKDPVTVMVEHRYRLSVPYIAVLFADGSLPEGDGEGLYRTLRAQATLSLEGVDPNLPPTPTLDRQP